MFDTWLHRSQNKQKYVVPFLKVAFSSDIKTMYLLCADSGKNFCSECRNKGWVVMIVETEEFSQ